MVPVSELAMKYTRVTPRLHRLFRHSLPALLSLDLEQETRLEDHKKRLEQLEAAVEKSEDE